MPRDLRAYLWDIIEAANHILTFVEGTSAAEYGRNPLLKAAVERKFEVIGEALTQASRVFPEASAHFANSAEIIAFRNRLIHGYSVVSDAVVWEIIQMDLPRLKSDAEALLEEHDG